MTKTAALGLVLLVACDGLIDERYQTLPAMERVAPGRGSISGGDAVRIDGVRLDVVQSVYFGDRPAEILEQAEDSLVVRTPAHAPQSVGLRFKAPNHAVCSDLRFVFEGKVSVYEPAPALTLTAEVLSAGDIDGDGDLDLVGVQRSGQTIDNLREAELGVAENLGVDAAGVTHFGPWTAAGSFMVQEWFEPKLTRVSADGAPPQWIFHYQNLRMGLHSIRAREGRLSVEPLHARIEASGEGPWVADWDLDGHLDMLFLGAEMVALWGPDFRAVTEGPGRTDDSDDSGGSGRPKVAGVLRPGSAPDGRVHLMVVSEDLQTERLQFSTGRSPDWRSIRPAADALDAGSLAAVADLNADGRVDYIRRSGGGGVLLHVTTATAGLVQVEVPSSDCDVRGSADVFDADGDGDVDILFGGDCILVQEGEGTFADKSMIFAPVITSRTAPLVADVNGDGHIDVLRLFDGSTRDSFTTARVHYGPWMGHAPTLPLAPTRDASALWVAPQAAAADVSTLATCFEADAPGPAPAVLYALTDNRTLTETRWSEAGRVTEVLHALPADPEDGTLNLAARLDLNADGISDFVFDRPRGEIRRGTLLVSTPGESLRVVPLEDAIDESFSSANSTTLNGKVVLAGHRSATPDLLELYTVGADGEPAALLQAERPPHEPLISNCGDCRCISAHHFDGDGVPDLLYGCAEGYVDIWFGALKDGALSFETKKQVEIFHGALFTPAVVDIDRDGQLDLVGGAYGSRIEVVRGLGGRAFQAPAVVSVSGGQYAAILGSGELDGDDVDELLFFTAKNQILSARWNADRTAFEPSEVLGDLTLFGDKSEPYPRLVMEFEGTGWIRYPDINGDRLSDLILSVSSHTHHASTRGRLEVWLGRASR